MGNRREKGKANRANQRAAHKNFYGTERLVWHYILPGVRGGEVEAMTIINGVRFQLSALLDLKKKAIQGAFFVHD